MSFFEKCIEKYEFREYFVVVMKRLCLDCPAAFTGLGENDEASVLKDFTKQLKKVARNEKDSHNAIILDHVFDVMGSYDYRNYKAPSAVKFMISGN